MTKDFRSYDHKQCKYHCKNENHLSLLSTRCSLLVIHYSEYKHPFWQLLLNFGTGCTVTHCVEGLHCEVTRVLKLRIYGCKVNTRMYNSKHACLKVKIAFKKKHAIYVEACR